MPLRALYHNLLKPNVQTPSSPLKPVIDHPSSVQEPDYFDSIDKLQRWAAASNALETRVWDITSSSSTVQTNSYQPHTSRFTRSDKSKVLVCHDFKGGYTEDPFERGYSFEFWHLVDTFVYFSHQRVTIPPRGWLDAGRRHGSKILGTVIFEWAESKRDLQECLYGEKLDSMQFTTDASALIFSTKYASHLITLAQARKFDGYLVNIETDLNFLPPVSSYPDKTQLEREEDASFLERERSLGGLGALISSEVLSRRAQRMHKNVNALLGWVGWLREEGKRRVGPHWEIIWYDSVTTAGQLNWQDALTPANAPFFMNAEAIFTNYTWARPPDPSPPGALQEPTPPQFEHHPMLLMSARMAENLNRPKSDVYIGIDVFGRNCYGGFDVGLSLGMIFPSRNFRRAGGSQEPCCPPGDDRQKQDLGLSVALFAPGWTWERAREGGGERTWSEWWEDELQFWVGRTMVEMPVRSGETGTATVGTFCGPRECCLLRTSSVLAGDPPLPTTGLGSIQSVLPLEGQRLTSKCFYTNFNRGSGNAWWVRGHKVHDVLPTADDLAERCGWTDIGLCFPKPDRIWPKPTLLHLLEFEDHGKCIPKPMIDDRVFLRTSLIDYEVWEGGTSLEIQGYFPEVADTSGSSRTILPLCTLQKFHLTHSDCYALEIVVKSLSDFAEVSTSHRLLFRPCILWADGEPHGRESYHFAQLPSDSAEVRDLANGWYSITVMAQLARATFHLPAEVVPVVALEIRHPLWLPDVAPAKLKLIVGEISLGALPRSLSITSSPLHDTAPPLHFPNDSHLRAAASSYNLFWKPVPPPNGAAPGTVWGILTWDPREDEADSIATGYYNIFASRKSAGKIGSGTNFPDCVWLGTSTYETDPNSFVVAGLRPSDLEQLTDLDLDLGIGVSAGPHSSAHADLRSGSGTSVHASRLISFTVERAGSFERLTSEGTRYACEVEY